MKDTLAESRLRQFTWGFEAGNTDRTGDPPSQVISPPQKPKLLYNGLYNCRWQFNVSNEGR